ncbi:MAG: fibronectin type III domain-containing protein, partial [Bacteroidales bacterium]|nr:fibronectin type III domain-containing protein [Bacteroidales bacterium]
MRKITVLLSLVLMASFVWAQNYSQQDREKMLRENEQRMLIDQKARSTFDASPFTPTASTVTAQKATWDILYSWSTSAPAEQAIACNGTNFYTTFWNGAGVFNKYSMAGVFESTFTIATASGIRDLAYDGQFYYGGASSSTLYQLDLVNQTQVSSIAATGITIRHCTYDPTADGGNGGFWIGNWTDLYLVSRTGAILTTGPAVADVYGSAYDDVTAGGPYLWFFSQSGASELVTLQQFRLSDMTLTGVEHVADNIPGFVSGSIAGGLEAYKDISTGKFVLLGDIQQDPNLIFGYELSVIAPLGAPNLPTAMTVTPGAAGALTASIAWTNPSTTVAGNPLTELTNIKVYRGETLIHTITSPTIGAAETYVDNAVPASGNYTYKVQGENAEGLGLSTTTTAFVGTDYPGAPVNVVLAASGNNGVITWEAPAVGLNGGYFVPTGLTYNVTRYPGAVAVATGISELTYTDNAVPGIGNYYYAVQAINATGPGGSANSNMVLLGAEGILFYESFTTVTIGSIPDGWVTEGAGTTNWVGSNTGNAGGEAPELRMSYSPSFNGDYRLSTPDFSIEDYTALKLSFRHMLDNYTSDEGEELGVYVSYDAGATWVELWNSVIGTTDIPPTLNEFFIDVPPAKANMRISWLFSGNSFNIDNYYIDDVVVEPVVENDLKAISLTGSATPTAGVAGTYSFTIQNAGTVTQDTYTVNLYKEGDVLIQTLPGVSIEFAANHTFEFTWTPEDGDVDNTDFLYANIVFAGDELPGNNQSGQLAVDVQPAGIIIIPIGDHTTLPDYRIPFDFYWKNSLSQTIYYPDEMDNAAGMLLSVALYNNFSSNIGPKAVKIWVGSTEMESLETGWVDPSTLTLVYDGEVTFPNGANTILIPLTTPYFHPGGKLVLYTNRVFEDGYYSSSDKFYVTDAPTHPNKTRHVQSDGTTYDPLAPPAPEAGQLLSS